MRAVIAPVLTTCLSGCFIGDEFGRATPDDIIKAAERWRLPNFTPTVEAEGNIIAAHIPKSLPDAAEKEGCICADLEKQGLEAIR